MINDKKFADDHILKVLNDPEKVTQIIQSGIRDALLKHKQAGHPICVWQDNKVVWIEAEDIKIDK